MGIRYVNFDYFEKSQSEEEWTISDDISIETILQIANEVWGFGLEVELVECAVDDAFRWRVVAIKSSTEIPSTKILVYTENRMEQDDGSLMENSREFDATEEGEAYGYLTKLVGQFYLEIVASTGTIRGIVTKAYGPKYEADPTKTVAPDCGVRFWVGGEVCGRVILQTIPL